MLTEILFLLLVLAIASLMVVDVARTHSENPHVQSDRPAYVAGQATTVPSRSPGAAAFTSEVAGSAATVPAARAAWLRCGPTTTGMRPMPTSTVLRSTTLP